ncbi:MAG TPA: c-type cytochrome [Bacteroidetes bacterium]|nr:c-type cytochrome [Bacteroidota bacterium]HEX04201.1 c-type cytochrome [Bacteroidota bacterium]
MRLPLLLVLLVAFLFMGCPGEDGSEGPAGPDGENWPGPVPAEYTAADGIAGGAAYSKWWSADAGGVGTQPTTTAGKDFYRCKACHAWDGLGNAGSYASRTGQSTLNDGRPDVSSVNLRAAAEAESYQELYDLVAHAGSRDIDAADNRHPDFAAQLTSDQIWNIVKFMVEEWIAPSDLYDLAVEGSSMYVDYTVDPPVVVAPTLTYTNIGAAGDAGAGDTIYADNCASCHGADGTTIDLGGRSVGQFAREKPNELWFKAKFGEDGYMDAGIVTDTGDMQDMYAALVNVTNYPDLP